MGEETSQLSPTNTNGASPNKQGLVQMSDESDTEFEQTKTENLRKFMQHTNPIESSSAIEASRRLGPTSDSNRTGTAQNEGGSVEGALHNNYNGIPSESSPEGLSKTD